MSALFQKLADMADARHEKAAPAGAEAETFSAFLEKHGRARGQRNEYRPYSFAGRAPLAFAVMLIDQVIREQLEDASISVCGGAQFGKTILYLHLALWALACARRNVAVYLPDDDLVAGVVDGKLRPEVLDQIPWIAERIAEGKDLTASGRAANRKGALSYVHGDGSTTVGYIRGMGKIPTTFSADIVIEDEKDDIDPRRSKFVEGRTASSDLRLRLSIGTQRMAGGGQNKEFLDGSQHVFELRDGAGNACVPEECWPGVLRMAADGFEQPNDPRATELGDFADKAGNRIAFDPAAHYYLAHPETGLPLDRENPQAFARRPERIKERRWSLRVSQLACSGISLRQIAKRWKEAVGDPFLMEVFRCEVLGDPASTAAKLTPEILLRAQEAAPFSPTLQPREGARIYAGVDMGNFGWLVLREVMGPGDRRVIWAEKIASADIAARIAQISAALRIDALVCDAHPQIDTARALCAGLNGTEGFDLRAAAMPKGSSGYDRAYLSLPGRIEWDGRIAQWRGARAAACQFNNNALGRTIHKLGTYDQGGALRVYPVLQMQRDDCISRAIGDLLTPAEGHVEVIGGEARQTPGILLPERKAGSPPIVEVLERHLLAGGRREIDPNTGEDKGFPDKCENHLLLALAYSRMAEELGEGNAARQIPPPMPAKGIGGRLAKLTQGIKTRAQRTLFPQS